MVAVSLGLLVRLVHKLAFLTVCFRVDSRVRVSLNLNRRDIVHISYPTRQNSRISTQRVDLIDLGIPSFSSTVDKLFVREIRPVGLILNSKYLPWGVCSKTRAIFGSISVIYRL